MKKIDISNTNNDQVVTKLFCCIILVVIICFANHTTLKAQESKSFDRKPSSALWLNTGLGKVKPGQHNGQAGLNVSLNLQRDKYFIAGNYLYSVEILPDTRYDKSSSISLTYNYIYKKEWWSLSAGTGLNFMWFNHKGRFDETLGMDLPDESFAKPGIPFDLQLFLHSKRVGLGLNPGVIINNEITTTYIMLALKISLITSH